MLCFACGLVGHIYKECGTGVFDEKKLGDWIRADDWRGRGGNSFHGGLRGGGMTMQGSWKHLVQSSAGQGEYFDWRNHPENRTKEDNEELKDTASSPVKPVDQHMLEMEKNAKKRLAFEQTEPPNTGILVITNTTQLEEGLPSAVKGREEESIKDKKMHKEDGTSNSEQSVGSAASLKGDRRKQ